ncbi:MAG: CoA transferase subunit A, partial [Bacteroidia bacterium]|nr:CoA transferase subunit A [Bacteroidia bacterium]
TGLDTLIEKGKRVIEIDGARYLLELPLRADVAIIRGSKGDEDGNLIYRGTSQNFCPLMAMAADVVIAEIGELVKVGDLSPESVHTPSIFVDYIVA